MYEPHRHADLLGLRVSYQEIGALYGLWVPRVGRILLKPGMTVRHERSVLAHEIAHVEYGHTTGSPKEEGLADVRAAERLICHREIGDLMRWTQEVPELAIELDVTEHVVRTYLRSKLWLSVERRAKVPYTSTEMAFALTSR